MVPEIWSTTDRIFWHFELLFPFYIPLTTQKIKILKKWKKPRRYNFTKVYHKWKSYNVSFLRYGVWQIFFDILGHFLHFYPTSNPKNQTFEKTNKKTLEVSSFCTSVPKKMIIFNTVPEIWCVTNVISFFFHFRIFFCLFTPITVPKIKKFKNWKKLLEILSFYTCVSKIMIR